MNRSKLIFTNHNQTLFIPWREIAGWKTMTGYSLQTVPETGERILKKDPNATKLSGKVLSVQQVELMLKDRTTYQLTPTESVEFLEFVDTQVEPEYWRSEKVGQVKVEAVDNPAVFNQLIQQKLPQRIQQPAKA